MRRTLKILCRGATSIAVRYPGNDWRCARCGESVLVVW